MDEKKLSKLLEVLVDKIESLELDIYIKNVDYQKLKEENERLRSENDFLRKDNVALTRELRGEVTFKRIDKEDINNG